jgi:hypothetical protein
MAEQKVQSNASEQIDHAAHFADGSSDRKMSASLTGVGGVKFTLGWEGMPEEPTLEAIRANVEQQTAMSLSSTITHFGTKFKASSKQRGKSMLAFLPRPVDGKRQLIPADGIIPETTPPALTGRGENVEPNGETSPANGRKAKAAK